MEDARSSKFQGGVAAPAVRRGLIVPAVVLLSLSPMAVLRALFLLARRSSRIRWTDRGKRACWAMCMPWRTSSQVRGWSSSEPGLALGSSESWPCKETRSWRGRCWPSWKDTIGPMQVGMAEARKKQVNHERSAQEKEACAGA